jgi:hypothetical protein
LAKLTPDRIFKVHLCIILALGLGFGAVVFADQMGHHRLFKISDMLRLDREGNLPSFFSALALLGGAMAANAVRMALPKDSPERLGWAIFAGAFLFMGVDEAVAIHELIGMPRQWQRLGGISHYLYYVGIFPYLLFALWLAIYLFPFWLRQSPTVRNSMAIAGICYVLAAIGMELLENKLVSTGVPYYSLRMSTNFAIEELGEMVAVAIFLRTFLTRLAELGGGYLLPVTIAPAPVTETRFDPAQTSPAFPRTPGAGLPRR